MKKTRIEILEATMAKALADIQREEDLAIFAALSASMPSRREYLVTWDRPNAPPIEVVDHQYYLSWTPEAGKRFVLNGIIVDHWVCDMDVELKQMFNVSVAPPEGGAPAKMVITGFKYPELWNQYCIHGSKLKHWSKDYRGGYCVVRGGRVVAAVEVDNKVKFV